MKRYVDETAVAASADQIYRALCDVARWPDWDDELERVTIAGEAVAAAARRIRMAGPTILGRNRRRRRPLR